MSYDSDTAITSSLKSNYQSSTNLNRPWPHRGGDVRILYKTYLELFTNIDLSLEHSECFSSTFRLPNSCPFTIIDILFTTYFNFKIFARIGTYVIISTIIIGD